MLLKIVSKFMRIKNIKVWREALPLTRPYTIAFQTVSSVDLLFVRLETDRGVMGLGSGSPAPNITGETAEACHTALSAAADTLQGRTLNSLGTVLQALAQATKGAPAAQAALDMAVYDAFTRALNVPLVDFFGRCHDALPTSITIGIKSVDATLEEAHEYVGGGFNVLKVKLGHDFEVDLERLRALRSEWGQRIVIRVDANQGYSIEETRSLADWGKRLALEFIEQPMPQHAIAVMRTLPTDLREQMAADESLHDTTDAITLLQPEPAFGIYNIKLMKCGGLTEARRIASVADMANRRVMWGCMDESKISISAALHTAYASPATRYLDLDGSLDLSRDVAAGGFGISNGVMRLVGEAGLGVSLI